MGLKSFLKDHFIFFKNFFKRYLRFSSYDSMQMHHRKNFKPIHFVFSSWKKSSRKIQYIHFLIYCSPFYLIPNSLFLITYSLKYIFCRRSILKLISCFTLMGLKSFLKDPFFQEPFLRDIWDSHDTKIDEASRKNASASELIMLGAIFILLKGVLRLFWTTHPPT